MSEPVSIVAKAAFQQPDAQANLKSQTGGGKAFEEVLQNGANKTQTPDANQQTATSANSQPVDRVQNSKLDQLQVDLTNRVNGLGGGQSPLTKFDILPDLLNTKGRMGLLGEALGKNNIKTSPNGNNILGRFGQVENEYKDIENMMKSNKDFSPGELLGLQARLYQVGQHIEVMSKVVDQVTGGIKTILNTNV